MNVIRMAGLALILVSVGACGSSSSTLGPPDCPDVLQAGLVAATTCVATHGAVEGRVLDAADNEPVVGALVGTNPATSTALTDAEGRFEIEGIALEAGPRQLSVTASREGYLSTSSEVVLSGETARVGVDLPLVPVPERTGPGSATTPR